MKKSIYITLALAGIFSKHSFKDDEFLSCKLRLGIKAENAFFLLGDNTHFSDKDFAAEVTPFTFD